MALNLYKHFAYGTLSYSQVDSNWTDIESEVNGLSGRLPLNNYSATSDPTVNDDVTQGYSAGSLWYNRSNNQIFLLVSANSGAAHWVDYAAGSPIPIGTFGVIRSDVSAMVADIELRVGVSVQTLEYTSGYGYEGGNLYQITTEDGQAHIMLDNGLYAKPLFPNGVHGKQLGIAPDMPVALDDEISLMCNLFRGTGDVVTLSKGVYRITRSHSIEGFALDLSEGAEIEVYGDVAATFTTGGLQLLAGARLVRGVVYTNGSMPSEWSGSFAGRTCAIFCNGGEVEDTEVYSQLFSTVKHSDGEMRVHMYGGSYRGLESVLSVDKEYNLDIRYFNAGIRYINKSAVAGVPSDSRAVNIRATTTIKEALRINVEGERSWKNGVWLSSSDWQTVAIESLRLTGRVGNAGYYLDENGVEQLGHGASTPLTVEACPGAVLSLETYRPLGYNVAVASGSHRAKVIGGSHVGEGGDPNIVVANSDDVLVATHLRRGTVGVSVGEDGATSNRCRIVSTFEDNSYVPIRFSSGIGLFVEGCSFAGEPFASQSVGGFAGTGKVRPVVDVLAGANDISFIGNTIRGWFTYDVIDKVGGGGRLRVFRDGNTFQAPILPRSDMQYSPLLRHLDGANNYTPLIEGGGTGGHADVGEVAILGSDAQQYASLDLASSVRDLTALAEAGEDLSSVLKKWAVLIYVQYVPAMDRKLIRFGISGSTNANNTPVYFYSPFDGSDGSNSISGKLHQLTAGEWVPLTFNLDLAVHNSADPAALLKFMVYKTQDGETYDLTMTNPVMIYVGKDETPIP